MGNQASTVTDLLDATADCVVLGEITVGRGPIADMVVSPAGDRLLVTNCGDDSVSVIDTATFAVVTTITGTDEAFALAVTDDCAYVNTVTAAYDSISVIDTNTGAVITDHPLALSLRDTVVSPDGGTVYTSRTGSDGADVAVLDTATDGVTTIEVATATGTSAESMSISPDGKRLYLAVIDAVGGSEVVVIDSEMGRIVDAVIVDAPVRDVAIDRDGAAVYVLSCERAKGGMVDVIDTSTNTITETVVLGGSPTQLALDSESGHAYVVDADHVSMVSTVTYEVIETIAVGAQPSCVTLSPDGERLYIADNAGRITVLSVAATPAAHLQMMEIDIFVEQELTQRELTAV